MMANAIWLDHYPPGVPARIDPDTFRSIPDLLAQAAVRFADKPAFHNLGRTLSYTDVDRLSRDFAAFLQHLPDLHRGDRVAIMAPNLLQYPVALLGVLRAGMVVVNINPLYKPRELAHQLEDCGAKAIVIVETCANVLQQVVGASAIRHVIVSSVGEMLPWFKRIVVDLVTRYLKKLVPAWRLDGAIGFRSSLKRGATLKLAPVEARSSDIAFLQYTGGTTGVAKGAMLTHRNILANVEQTAAWIGPSLTDGTEIAIDPLPLYHIFCLTSILSYMKRGALNVLITNPRDLDGLVAELRRWKFTIFTGVNTLFNGLVHNPGFPRLDFSSLKITVGGGAAVQQTVAEAWQRVTGKPITSAYGLTEASPGVTANRVDEAWNPSAGMPFPSTEVAVRDALGNELPPWPGRGDIAPHVGGIFVRGPQVMAGYWKRPAETAAVLSADGWLDTGDVGYQDRRGYLTLTDRKKDIILVSGFNVYPNEIEDVVSALPGVLECGVVGVPDERTGEAVKLVIVRKDPQLTEEAVRAYCREQLTGYKLPRHIEFRDALPKSPIGKVLRRELRAPTTG